MPGRGRIPNLGDIGAYGSCSSSFIYCFSSINFLSFAIFSFKSLNAVFVLWKGWLLICCLTIFKVSIVSPPIAYIIFSLTKINIEFSSIWSSSRNFFNSAFSSEIFLSVSSIFSRASTLYSFIPELYIYFFLEMTGLSYTSKWDFECDLSWIFLIPSWRDFIWLSFLRN